MVNTAQYIVMAEFISQQVKFLELEIFELYQKEWKLWYFDAQR